MSVSLYLSNSCTKNVSGDEKLCKAKEDSKNEWGTWVRPCQLEEAPDIMAVAIQTILTDSGFECIDILKIDIEGAEIEVFAHNFRSWIDKVDTFLIELHSNDCARIFQSALSGGIFAFSVHGEITVANRTVNEGR